MSAQPASDYATTATPDEQRAIAETAEVVDATVRAANQIEVRNGEEAQAATAFLVQIAKAKKGAESARTALVKPLNDHVKFINGEFKAKVEPLDQADQIVRGKVLAYHEEQERIRAVEQARLDAEAEERRQAAERERQAAEAKARADREAAEAEAKRIADEQAANERARVAALAAETDQIRARAAQSPDATLEAVKDRQDAFGAAARDELASRAQRRAAEEQAAAVERDRLAAVAAEESARNAPVVEVPAVQVAAVPTTVRSAGGGSASTRQRWVGEVVDETQVPREFLVVDQKKINAAVKAGVRSIPGVKIEQTTDLSVRAA